MFIQVDRIEAVNDGLSLATGADVRGSRNCTSAVHRRDWPRETVMSDDPDETHRPLRQPSRALPSRTVSRTPTRREGGKSHAADAVVRFGRDLSLSDKRRCEVPTDRITSHR